MTALLDHGPSELYVAARTPAEVDDLYRAAWTTAADAYGSPVAVPRDHRDALMEDHRRAHVAIVAMLPRVQTGERKPRPPVVHTSRVTGKGPTIDLTCEGPCGLTMTEKKFPTLSKGGRGKVCRDCLAAERAAKKAGC